MLVSAVVGEYRKSRVQHRTCRRGRDSSDESRVSELRWLDCIVIEEAGQRRGRRENQDPGGRNRGLGIGLGIGLGVSPMV